MSARGYALHNFCTQFSFFLFLPTAFGREVTQTKSHIPPNIQVFKLLTDEKVTDVHSVRLAIQLPCALLIAKIVFESRDDIAFRAVNLGEVEFLPQLDNIVEPGCSLELSGKFSPFQRFDWHKLADYNAPMIGYQNRKWRHPPEVTMNETTLHAKWTNITAEDLGHYELRLLYLPLKREQVNLLSLGTVLTLRMDGPTSPVMSFTPCQNSNARLIQQTGTVYIVPQIQQKRNCLKVRLQGNPLPFVGLARVDGNFSALFGFTPPEYHRQFTRTFADVFYKVPSLETGEETYYVITAKNRVGYTSVKVKLVAYDPVTIPWQAARQSHDHIHGSTKVYYAIFF